MTFTSPYSDEFKETVLTHYAISKNISATAREFKVDRKAIGKWLKKRRGNPVVITNTVGIETKVEDIRPGARIMFLDIETLPNMGFFFDTYSERSIPLQFIIKPKSVCSISWKFLGDAEPRVIAVQTPYDDKSILEQILPEFEKCDYVVWHYGEGFDRKFLEGRLFANGLPSLPPVASIDTCKLARNKWGQTLNSNKLDHIAEIMGLGKKIKTDASLWVRCANGDIDAMQEMMIYNAQDVTLLEGVYHGLAKNIKSKVNQNLIHDDVVTRCKPCGSENIEHKGFELTAATLRHRYQCRDCLAWSTYPRKKPLSKDVANAPSPV